MGLHSEVWQGQSYEHGVRVPRGKAAWEGSQSLIFGENPIPSRGLPTRAMARLDLARGQPDMC